MVLSNDYIVSFMAGRSIQSSLKIPWGRLGMTGGCLQSEHSGGKGKRTEFFSLCAEGSHTCGGQRRKWVTSTFVLFFIAVIKHHDQVKL